MDHLTEEPARPMRVVQVNYAFDPGVREPQALLDRYTTLTGWSDALVWSGVEVHVVQRFHHDECTDRRSATPLVGRRATASAERGRNVEYIFCGDGPARTSTWFTGRRIARAVAALHPDLVHVNGLEFGLPTWTLMRQLPQTTACVIQHHGGGVPDGDKRSTKRRVTRAIRRELLAVADAFLFSTAAQAEPWRQSGAIGQAQSVYGVMEASTALRPIDRATARQMTGVDGNPAMLWVGRLDANKDPLTVLAAFEQCLGVLPDATLSMIYSSDEFLPAVRALIGASAALGRSVRLLGAMPHAQIAEFYSAADIFVLGSHHEGSGYALLEASACGCVPIVTDIPSFRAITNNGTLGASWTPGDVDGCRRAIVSVAMSDLTAARAAVRDHFERELSWSAVGRAAKRAYQDVLDRKRLRLGVASAG